MVIHYLEHPLNVYCPYPNGAPVSKHKPLGGFYRKCYLHTHGENSYTDALLLEPNLAIL